MAIQIEDEIASTADSTDVVLVRRGDVGAYTIEVVLLSDIVGISWGEITGTLNDQTDLADRFNEKQSILVSGGNIKTINGNTLLGAGDLVIAPAAAWGGITGTLSDQADLQAALDAKANVAGQAFTGAISATNLSGANTGDQTITLTGNVTGSGTGSFATTIANAAVTYAKMQATSLGNVVIGKSGAAGTLTEIQLGTNQFLGRGAGNITTIGIGSGLTITGSTLDVTAGTYVLVSGFDAAVAATPAVTANTAKVTNATHTGDVTGATALTIANDAVTNAKAANMATATIKGRVTAGTGDPEDLTGTQATTLLDAFTSALKGLAPASGGGTSNFLRADGTWAAPPGGSTTVLTSTSTGAQDNWNPGTLGAETLIKWSGTSPLILRGLVGASDGYHVRFANTGTTVSAVIQVEATTSTATNRIAAQTINPQHVIVLPGEMVDLVYTGSRFTIAAEAQGGLRSRGDWHSSRPTGFSANRYDNGMDLTSLGNLTSVTPTGTAVFQNRVSWVANTTAVAGGIGGSYGTNAILVPTAGFLAHTRFNFSRAFPDTVDTANPASANSVFVGVAETNSIGATTDIAAAAGAIAGWGRDPADAANLYAYHNDNPGAPTKVDVGANFPTLTAAAVFDGWVFMPPGGAALTMILMRADDLSIAPSVEHYTTQLPNANMRHLQQIANRAAAARYHLKFPINEAWRP